MSKFPFYKQTESKDCGPTCIKIIAKHYGRILNTEKLRLLSETTREGSTLLGLSEAVESIGFRSVGVKIALNQLKEVPLPCIVHWNKVHYVVVYAVKTRKKETTVYVSDPAHGLISYTQEEFIRAWIGNNAHADTEEGVALLVEPTPNFYNDDLEEAPQQFGFQFISKYLFKYKRFIVQLILGLIAGSLLQLIVPFLTQSIVDVGIKNKDINFVYLVLIAQLSLFIGRTLINVLRSWILLHLSTRINISLISDFFIKLMNLPISYFDVKMTGDLMQRINDHRRIEQLLTMSSLSVLFSMVNLVVFSIVLIYYNWVIFGIFAIGSIIYFAWILIFFKKRKKLDYKRFSQVSEEQSKVIELVNGMQEIKLHNAEKRKRWNWEFVQAKLFKISVENLALEQYQNVGSSFINELKNIIITVVAAILVIDGKITLGMMLAITAIVGQLNAPISQLINFLRDVQDAQISLERLGEIHHKENEEDASEERIQDIPEDAGFTLQDVNFRYTGADKMVLQQLSLSIPAHKTTAIVGTSGSGKTTLMKLLLKFYDPNEGSIHIGAHDLLNISQRAWREQFGVVMQEGYVFNDTIANNIAVGDEYVDKKKLAHAVDIANIKEFIESLPLSYNTKIGMEGMGLSTGQKQRMFIARAVYKNPKFLFFDEATSALDANNEKAIMEKLDTFLEDKTVVVIAHRLSTVKNAHQIVVLDEGKVAEIGNHKTLIQQKGKYYHLVKNQLELGS